MTKKIDYLIIGAGVTGLSFANFIDSDDYLILEKDSEPGGYCKTIRKEGFVWDYSGHFFHFKRKEVEDYLISRMNTGEQVVTVHKNTKILFKDKYVELPFQKNIHQLDKNDFIDCLYDLFFKEEKKTFKNFKEMLYGKFGNTIAELFLIPYNEKLYACDLSNLDVDAMGRFFPHTNLRDIISNFKNPNNLSYNSTFTYPINGAIQYINALLKDINSEKLIFNSNVTEINHNEKYVIANGERIHFDHLISSMPFNKFLGQIGEREHADNLSYNKVLVFNLGFDKKGNNEHHWVYFPERKYRFYRIGYYDNIVQQSRMSLYVEIGLKPDHVVNETKELKLVLNDLKKAGIITDQELVAYHSVVLNPAYVHINKYSNNLYAEFSEKLKHNNIYSVGRYGAWRYCSIEDNIIEAMQLANSLNKVLSC